MCGKLELVAAVRAHEHHRAELEAAYARLQRESGASASNPAAPGVVTQVAADLKVDAGLNPN